MQRISQLVFSCICVKRQLQTWCNTQFLRSVFKHIGAGSKIDPSVYYEDPQKIWVGEGCEVRRGVILIGRSGRPIGIEMAKGVHIHQYAYLNAFGGFIKLGEGVRIGHHSVIGGQGGVTFGDFSGVSGLSYVIAANHGYAELDKPIVLQTESKKGINIGRNVWGCAGTIITDGVTIGDNAIIGAGAVVRRDVPSKAVVIGNPAEIAFIQQ